MLTRWVFSGHTLCQVQIEEYGLEIEVEECRLLVISQASHHVLYGVHQSKHLKVLPVGPEICNSFHKLLSKEVTIQVTLCNFPDLVVQTILLELVCF